MEKVIIAFRDLKEVDKAMSAIGAVYTGELGTTKDGLGLILPAKILDWSAVFTQYNVPYRGALSI